MFVRWRRVFLSVIVAAVVVYLLWDRTDQESIRSLAESASPVWFATGIACFFLYQLFRAWRLRLLFDGTPGLGSLTVTMMVQAFANNMLPSGLGEAVQVWLLKRRHGIALLRGTGVLIVARLSDLFVFVALFAGLQAFSSDIPREVSLVMLVLVALLGIAVLGLIALGRIGRTAFDGRWQEKTEMLLSALRACRDIGLFVPMLGLTAVMWLLMYGVFMAILQTLNSDLSLLQVLWIYILFFPVNFLPIKGIASTGTHHLAWYVTLQLVGLDEQSAAAYAFAGHLVLLGIVCAVALPGFLLFFARPSEA